MFPQHFIFSRVWLWFTFRTRSLIGLKKVLDGIYSTYLPKGSHPFVYLSLQLDPRNVDVNVHPTKHEVHFLHEDLIIAEIGNSVDITLQGSNQSRTFYIQVSWILNSNSLKFVFAKVNLVTVSPIILTPIPYSLCFPGQVLLLKQMRNPKKRSWPQKMHHLTPA